MKFNSFYKSNKVFNTQLNGNRIFSSYLKSNRVFNIVINNFNALVGYMAKININFGMTIKQIKFLQNIFPKFQLGDVSFGVNRIKFTVKKTVNFYNNLNMAFSQIRFTTKIRSVSIPTSMDIRMWPSIFRAISNTRFYNFFNITAHGKKRVYTLLSDYDSQNLSALDSQTLQALDYTETTF